MANRVKEVSAFDGTSWGAAVPLGVNDSNVDITSSTTQPDGSAVSGIAGDTATALDTSAVIVSEGDTGASAWTKFNRFRKRVASNFANYIQGSIATSYNATGSDSAVYSTNVLNNYMANVIGYSGTTAPSAGTVAAQLSSLNDNIDQTIMTVESERGYCKIFNGTLIQWGIATGDNVSANSTGAATLTFAIPFISNDPEYIVTLAGRWTTIPAHRAFNIKEKQLSKIILNVQNDFNGAWTAPSCDVIAIGRWK